MLNLFNHNFDFTPFNFYRDTLSFELIINDICFVKVINKLSHNDVQFWKLRFGPFGRPKMYVHTFLIDGLLIDTGQPRLKQEVVKTLESQRIERIIITHHHEDHSGNIEILKKSKSVKAYASPLCCEIMKKPPRVSPAQWMTWGQNKAAELLPLELTGPVFTDKYTFDIIETPGHAIDHICLHEKNQGWLFSGDIYLNDYVKIFMRSEIINDQIKSIIKLIRLDFDVLFCNHNPQIKNGKERLKAKLQFLQDFRGKVKNESARGLTAKEIQRKIGLKESFFVKFLSVGELSVINMVQSAMNE